MHSDHVKIDELYVHMYIALTTHRMYRLLLCSYIFRSAGMPSCVLQATYAS